jgi:hypothetical protein
MSIVADNLIEIMRMLGWAAMWGLGGIWIARSAFTLRKNELVLTGLAMGLIVENWLSNLLGQLLPLPLAFWIAAALVLAAGLLFSLLQLRQDPRSLFRIPVSPLQILVLLVLIYVFFGIGRGLAIQDDYQNLPAAAMIATGDIPPHFPLDPDISYGYHYFTLLFAAQIMHIADVFVWTALDMARAVAFAFSIMISGLFIQRVTNSVLAGFTGGMMAVFAGGTRWLLLLLPTSILQRISANLTMLGSAAQTGENLAAALVSPWSAAGLGPFPFPFAFLNGYNGTGILGYHSGAGALGGLITGILLLTHNKWKGWQAWVMTTIMLAALGIASEVSLSVICMGITLVLLVYIVKERVWQAPRRLPRSLWRWFAAAVAGGTIALFQGGVITTLALSTLADWFPSLIHASPAYHTFTFSFFWPPKILSSHLGYLALNDPAQILLALAEIGPVLILFPLAAAWMVKAYRSQRWFECFYGAAALASLILLVVELSGAAGLTALTRIQNLLVGVVGAFGLPALWLWARHRSDRIKSWSAAFLFTTMFGGFVLFGISLIAAQRPVLSDFIDPMDTSMSTAYFDRLEKDAIVFDPLVYRAPVVLGRPGRSSIDFYRIKPEFEALAANPDPFALTTAGYDYIYLDSKYWNSLSENARTGLQADCVVLVHEVLHKRLPDFRRLLDIQTCR